MLNPYVDKDATGVAWLHWTKDPAAARYDIITPAGKHVQAGATATSAKLGKPAEPFTVSIAPIHTDAYEDASFPPLTPPPPALTVTQSIPDGATLTAPVEWSANPSTDADVDFYIDGVLKWTEHIRPYIYQGDGQKLDPATLPNGDHGLKVIATTAAGATASAMSKVAVNVAEPPPPPPTSTGLPLFMSKFGPATDSYLNSADATRKAWVKAHHNRGTALPIVYVTNWNSWMNNQLYVDVAAIYDPAHPDHASAPTPDWTLVLKDSNGNPLWIRWGTQVNGHYPQYAADQSHPRWRQMILDRCKAAIGRGHKGIHMDDVNLPMSLTGTPAAPLNTPNAQKDAVCGLLEYVRQNMPGVPISQNSRWFDSPNHDGKDSYVERQIKSCDMCTIERGLDDAGVHGGTDSWSMNRLFQYVDTVHSLGCSVLWMAYTPASNTAMIEANLAAYWLCRELKDGVCGGGQTDSNWFPLYDVDLGAAKGPRTYTSGTYRREFARGYVTLTDNKVGRVVKTL